METRLKDRVCPAILTIPVIRWKSIISDRDDCDDRSNRMFSAIVKNHMKTRLYREIYNISIDCIKEAISIVWLVLGLNFFHRRYLV